MAEPNLPLIVLLANTLRRAQSTYAVFFCAEGQHHRYFDELARLPIVVTVNDAYYERYTELLKERTNCKSDCQIKHTNSEDCRTIRLVTALEMLGIRIGDYSYSLIRELHDTLPIDLHLMPDNFGHFINEVKDKSRFSSRLFVVWMSQTAERIDVDQVWWERFVRI